MSVGCFFKFFLNFFLVPTVVKCTSYTLLCSFSDITALQLLLQSALCFLLLVALCVVYTVREMMQAV